MKKMKIVLWLILIGLVVLIVWQNKDYLVDQTQGLTFDTYVAGTYETPPLPHALWFAACFIMGLLIAYFTSLMERFRSRRTIKELKVKNDSLLDLISQLRKELESKQTPSTPEEASTIDVTASSQQTGSE